MLADRHASRSRPVGVIPPLLHHMRYNVVEEQVLYRLHVVGERGRLSENETSLANFIFLHVALVLAHRSLLGRQVTFRGDERNRQCLGALVEAQLVKPFLQTAEALL